MTKVGKDFDFDTSFGGYTMEKCKGRCLDNWGKDTFDCFPEQVKIECQANGLKLTAGLRLVFKFLKKF